MMKTRRAFIKAGVIAGTSLSLGPSPTLSQDRDQLLEVRKSTEALEVVRVGFVGIGVKGSQHLGILLHMEGVEIVAVCDIIEDQCIESAGSSA